MKSNGGQKALYIGLCMLAAVVVWIFADNYGTDGSPITYEKWFRDIPITYTSETVLTGRGLMLLEEGTDATVDLKMQGSHWDLALLDSDYIRVTVDLSDVTRTGEQTVSSILVSFTYPYFNGRITRTQQSPSPITLNVAELYHKTVDVRCEITGNVAEGYSAGELQISPTEIEVRGDQADVDAVSYAKVTLDLGEDATSTVSGELPIQFYDENDQLLEDTSLQTTEETIQVTLPVYVTKELRLTMDFQESAGARMSNVTWRIEPATILVSGPAEVLNGMDSIVLDEFDLAGLGSTTNYSYAIPIPEGCENLSGVTHGQFAGDRGGGILPQIQGHLGVADGIQLHPDQRAGGPERGPADRAAVREHLRHQRRRGGHHGGQHPGDRGPVGLRFRRGHLYRACGGDGAGPGRRSFRRPLPGTGHHFRTDRRSAGGA